MIRRHLVAARRQRLPGPAVREPSGHPAAPSGTPRGQGDAQACPRPPAPQWHPSVHGIYTSTHTCGVSFLPCARAPGWGRLHRKPAAPRRGGYRGRAGGSPGPPRRGGQPRGRGAPRPRGEPEGGARPVPPRPPGAIPPRSSPPVGPARGAPSARRARAGPAALCRGEAICSFAPVKRKSTRNSIKAALAKGVI